MAMQNGAIYARISRVMDETDRLGVTRQIQDCRDLAARRGDHITRVYADNDFSASSTSVRRPDYETMLAQIRDGHHDGVIVWDLDRLHRQPKELEEFIDLADRFGLELANVGGEVDLSTPQDRLTARIKGAVAKHEAEQMGRRVRRKHRELAEAGKNSGGGRRPYGFCHDRVTLHTRPFCTLGSRETINGEVEVIRELARRVLAGDPLGVLERDLNQRGVHTSTGSTWQKRTIVQVLTQPRTAGLRQYQGQVIGKAAWAPILDRATWEAVCTVLRNPDRRPRGISNARKWLLSGIVYCSECGSPLRCKQPTGHAQRTYQCRRPGCGKVSINQPRLDKMVEELVIGRAERGKVRPLFDGTAAEEEILSLKTQLDAVDARLAEVGRDFARDKTMPQPFVRAMVAELQGERDQLQARLDELQADSAWSDALDGIPPSELRRLWASEELSFARKRGIVARVTADSLAVFPTHRRGKGAFDPGRVSVLAWEPWRRRGTAFDPDRAS
jgi:DNA invertase Pin-like site-specific DNA recombinase